MIFPNINILPIGILLCEFSATHIHVCAMSAHITPSTFFAVMLFLIPLQQQKQYVRFFLWTLCHIFPVWFCLHCVNDVFLSDNICALIVCVNSVFQIWLIERSGDRPISFRIASHSYENVERVILKIKFRNGIDLRVHWLAMQSSNCNGRNTVLILIFSRSLVPLLSLRCELVLF